MKSYRKRVMAGFRDEMKKRHDAFGYVAEGFAKQHCPVGTPESTGIEGYVGGRLRADIGHDADEDGVIIGTNVRYGPYVHNGTYDYKNEEWSEAELAELDSIRTNVGTDDEVDGKRGMPPRPFLVQGLFDAKPLAKGIYGREIRGNL